MTTPSTPANNSTDATGYGDIVTKIIKHLVSSGGIDNEGKPLPIYYTKDECPPLPPTKVRHRGDKIDQRGRVSALCFPKPRAIDMKRATWVMRDEAVTCRNCLAIINARAQQPNTQAQRAA